MVLTGEIPACFTVGRDAEVEAILLFASQPLFTARSNLILSAKISKDERPCDPSTWRHQSRIGVVNGYEYPEDVSLFLRDKMIETEVVTSEEAGLRMLARGRLDGMILNLGDGKPLKYVENMAQVTLTEAVACTLGSIPSYIAFSPRHPLGPLGRDAFNAGYKVITGNGVLEAIIRRWNQVDAMPD
jgi:ABC-type amino acid transport substrate-binding protein